MKTAITLILAGQILLLLVYWQIQPSKTDDMTLKEEFSSISEDLMAMSVNMVILQAVSLQSLSDFMVRKIEANLKDQPRPANTVNSSRSKCYDFLKYKNQKFEIIEDAKDKAYEFIRNVLRLKIDTKICERQELVQTLMCLMAVSNNLNSLFKDRLRILAPLVVILNSTLSHLMEDYKGCLNQLTLWPNIIDPFALGPSFVTKEQPHTDRLECTHVEAFIDITTGEVVTTPCNKSLDKNFYRTS